MKKYNVLKKSLLIVSVAIISIMLFSCKQNEKCVIKGKVVGVSNKAIVLVRAGESYRNEGVDVPIKSDSTFTYEFDIDYPEGCRLYLDNIRTRGGRRMTFFLEPGEINITVYAEREFNKNTVTGGKLNKEYQKFVQDIEEFNLQYDSELDSLRQADDQLLDNNLYYSNSSKKESIYISNAEVEKTIKFISSRSCDKRTDYSKEVISIYTRFREIDEETNNWLFNKINKDQSIVSYYFFINNIDDFKQYLDQSTIRKTHKSFVSKYPNHPYNDYAKNLLIQLRVGEKYIDFTAPDINGNLVKLSEKINDKIAIIDLWASWCTPCIRKSKQLIPIYNEFKDKGFTVVGLANEYKNTKNLQERLEEDEYPWINLYDLDEKYKIAEQYDGGNMILLIDKDGTILAINPSPEDIKQILMEKLKI